jgi:hypothetical protein
MQSTDTGAATSAGDMWGGFVGFNA